MCRYSYNYYRSVYACFDCRIAWKGPRSQYGEHTQTGTMCCLKCQKQGLNMGRDFTAPRQSQKGQWKKLYVMTNNGTTRGLFDSCGCSPIRKRNPVRTFADAKRHKRGGDTTGLSRRVAA